MTCLVCGKTPTVRSHLIPRAMAREVQVGTGHAVIKRPGEFIHTQSGLYETSILCADCDNALGRIENIAAKAFRRIRQEAKKLGEGKYWIAGVSGDDILRFLAGVMWKFSVASTRHEKIQLGPYQQIAQELAFSDGLLPDSCDAWLVRLKIKEDDDSVFAYRAPKPDRIHGVNGYRLILGGVFAFVKTDQRKPQWGGLEGHSIKAKADLPYSVEWAQRFPEYRVAASLTHRGKLSEYLDKQQG